MPPCGRSAPTTAIDKNSVADMQAAINEVGAIYVSADVHGAGTSEHEVDDCRSIPSPGSASGGHAFALVGYDANGFIVQNSWGTTGAFTASPA